MSYRDHKHLVHTWIHQWTDEEWNKKGAVHSTMERFPSKKWSHEGSHRGGIYGCTYRSYDTVIACIAWSNKLRQHVVLMEHNCECGWSKTTSKTIGELRYAIPGDKRIVMVNSMLCGGILDDAVYSHTETPATPEHIKKISKAILSQVDEFWDSPDRKITQQAWRSKFCKLLGNLIDLADVFGHSATGISAAKVAWAKDERQRIKLWDPQYAKLTAAEIAEKLAKKNAEVAKQQLNRVIKSLHDKIEYVTKTTAIPQNLAECFELASTVDAAKILKGLVLAMPHVDVDPDHSSAFRELGHVMDFLRCIVLSQSVFWDKDKICVSIKKTRSADCALCGITYEPRFNDAFALSDLLTFSESASVCRSLRHCSVPLRDAKLLLHAYCSGRAIHGKTVGGYRIVSANKTQVQVGCHRFSGAYLQALHKSMCNDLTASECDLRKKGVQFINNYILYTYTPPEFT